MNTNRMTPTAMNTNERQSASASAPVADNGTEQSRSSDGAACSASSSFTVGVEQSREDMEDHREFLLRRLESLRSGLLDGGYLNHLLRCATEEGYLEARAKTTESQNRFDREQYDLWLKHYGPDPTAWIQATIRSTERDLLLLSQPSQESENLAGVPQCDPR